MLTAYGERFNASSPPGEYPRPQLVRDSYLNLNGRWEFVGAPRDKVPERFSAEIVVPFPPESELSGVGRACPKGYALWYRRAFRLPEGFRRGRVLVHFDAVDQTATVWCNGQRVAFHAGGYTGFTADITDALWEENILIVRAEDDMNGPCSFGAQKRHSPWSGIWQSVWCESVPEPYVDSLRLIPRLGEGALELTVLPGGGAQPGAPCTALLEGVAYQMTAGEPYILPVPGWEPWTPENPKLYGVQITLGEDVVSSYFAMREFTVGRDEAGAPRFLLNGAPYFVNGVLYAGYWPDGLCTAPDDAALADDVAAARSLGFNALRLRDKVECPRFYWHCDSQGMLIWQGIPTGGRDAPPRLPARDSQYVFYGRKEPESRQQFMRELRESVELLRNAPSVVLWELFDEGRGQFDAENLLRFAAELDDTRPLDASSGAEALCGQVRSFHSFGRRWQYEPDASGRAVALTAFGGFGNVADGHVWSDSAGAKPLYDSPQRLTFALQELYAGTVQPAAEAGLAGCFYSQLTDVENDASGLLTYDRKIFKVAPKEMRRLDRVKS